MPDDSDTNTNLPNTPLQPAGEDYGAVDPIIPEEAVTNLESTPINNQDDDYVIPDLPTVEKIADKINDSHNILVALSSDPSVDELAAAIGIALNLDRKSKRVTAIYSGVTPNALKFLKPEETLEKNPDILQDFVIALNKDKADHLRYKIDGEYVKIFITPYKAKITQEDLEFSYGDYNVDLVIALDVANGVDLDSALREHGRIMHDAVVINITTGKPGKLGEIEWSNKKASSVSEMSADLLYHIGNLEKEEATAFLTGIVAATNRFANAHTTSHSLRLSSRLMESGANQQLVAKNITPETDNDFFGAVSMPTASESDDEEPEDKEKESKPEDPTKLNIEHGNEPDADETKEVQTEVTEKESTLLDDLKAAEATLAGVATEVTEDDSNKPYRIGGSSKPESDEKEEKEDEKDEKEEEKNEKDEEKEESEKPEEKASASDSPEDKKEESSEEKKTEDEKPATPPFTPPVAAPIIPNVSNDTEPKPEKVIAAPTNLKTETLTQGTNKYGQMLEDALSDGGDSFSSEPEPEPAGAAPFGTTLDATPIPNPAASATPSVPSAPEINGVPEMNYMPMPGDEILPPPPAPPVDFSNPAPSPSFSPNIPPTPPSNPVSPNPIPGGANLGGQPAMQDQIYGPQASTPDSFKIPGM